MLPRRAVELLREPEAARLELAPHLRDRHLVLGLDRHLRIFPAELDQRDATAGRERGPHRSERGLGRSELVVDVDEQDQFAAARGQPRIAVGRRDRHDVREARGGDALAQ